MSRQTWCHNGVTVTQSPQFADFPARARDLPHLRGDADTLPSDTTGSIIFHGIGTGARGSQKATKQRLSRRDARAADRSGLRPRFGKGDHWVYTHPRRPYPLTIDPRNPLLPAYVSKAIRAIEVVLAADANEDA